MNMMFKVSLLCIAVGVLQALPSRSGPMCTSHFDFLEKWVEKIIRFEIKLVSLEEKFEEKLKSLTEAIDYKFEQFTETVKSQSEALDSHNETLKSHNESLESHSETLKSHSKALESYNETLKSHNEALESHSETLKSHNETIITKYDSELSEMKTLMTYIEASNQTFSGLQETANSGVQAMIEQKLSDMKGELVKKDVVFQVKGYATQPTANGVVKFKTIMTNINNVYDLKSGYFRTPQSGTYWFAVQMCGRSDKGFAPSIFINNDVLVNRGVLRDKVYVDCETVTAVAILQAEDTVCVKSGPFMETSPLYENEKYHFNTFMGARVN